MGNDVTTYTAENAALDGWTGSATGIAVAGSEVGAVTSVAQVEAEIKASVFLAKQFPRNEAASITRIMKSCERPAFADTVAYAFPRGKKKDPASGQWVDNIITGPSVDLAREMARCWGNIRYGVRIVSLTKDEVHVQGWAFDQEANNYVAMEDRFARLIQRKVAGASGTKETQWVEPDERDLRELVNRRGAICVRNALLQILPPDVVDSALAHARHTLHKHAEGQLDANREDTIRKLVYQFDRLGVSAEMIERRLGHKLDLITVNELTELRGIFKSIDDGNTQRDEHFDFGNGNATTTKAPLNERVTNSKKKDATPAAEQASIV